MAVAEVGTWVFAGNDWHLCSALGAAIPPVAAERKLSLVRLGGRVTEAPVTEPEVFEFRVTKPTVDNVGIDAYWKDRLTDYDGPLTITVAGTVIRGKRIKNTIRINAANVLIENCELWGEDNTTYQALVECRTTGVKNAVIRKCESRVRTPGSPSSNGIMGHDYTLELCIIQDCIDAAGVYNTQVGTAAVATNVVIRGNVLGPLMYVTPYPSQKDNQSHNDGVQIQGGSGTKIYGNTFLSFGSRRVGNIDENPRGIQYQQVLSGVILTPAGSAAPGGPLHNTEIEDNWFDGAYVQININEKGQGNIKGLIIRRNKHNRTMYYAPKPGGNGQSFYTYALLPTYNLSAGSDSIISGNVNDLGQAINYSIGS